MTEEECHAIALKLPTFIQKDVWSWFRLVEAQFATKRVKSKLMKAAFVLSALPEEVFLRLNPWLKKQSDPSSIEYDDLKQEILRLYKQPESKRAQKIISLSQIGIGDLEPRLFMEKLQNLYWCEEGNPVDLLSELFLQALPSDVRSLLPDIDGKTHQELSDLAQTAWNSVMAAKQNSSTVKWPIHQAQTNSDASIDLQQVKKNNH